MRETSSSGAGLTLKSSVNIYPGSIILVDVSAAQKE